MFVLPQILLLGEKLIDLSSFKVSVPLKLNKDSGIIRLDGMVQGMVNGRFVGEMHGILYGSASVLASTGTMQNISDDAEDKDPSELLEDKDIIDTDSDIETDSTDTDTAEAGEASAREAEEEDGDE